MSVATSAHHIHDEPDQSHGQEAQTESREVATVATHHARRLEQISLRVRTIRGFPATAGFPTSCIQRPQHDSHNSRVSVDTSGIRSRTRTVTGRSRHSQQVIRQPSESTAAKACELAPVGEDFRPSSRNKYDQQQEHKGSKQTPNQHEPHQQPWDRKHAPPSQQHLPDRPCKGLANSVTLRTNPSAACTAFEARFRPVFLHRADPLRIKLRCRVRRPARGSH